MNQYLSIIFPVEYPYVLTQARHGWFLVNPNDIYVGRAILEYGEYSEIESQFLFQLLDREGVIIEVGANIGSHSIGLAKQLAVLQRRLIVYEPQPFIFQNLAANIALNALPNVLAWPFACSNVSGNVYFSEPDYTAMGNFGDVSMQTEMDAAAIRVPCVRLDDMAIHDRVGLIKLDVEGYELLVLQGAVDILSRFRPMLYLENDRIEKSQELIEWLWDQEYRLWWHTPYLFNKNNFKNNSVNIYPGIISCNMLGIPRELLRDVKGMTEVIKATWHPFQYLSL